MKRSISLKPVCYSLTTACLLVAIGAFATPVAAQEGGTAADSAQSSSDTMRGSGAGHGMNRGSGAGHGAMRGSGAGHGAMRGSGRGTA